MCFFGGSFGPIITPASPSLVQIGFADYNDDSADFAIDALAWTAVPNDGNGPNTNTSRLPPGVTTILDTSTGSLDFSELRVGDTLLCRIDFQITPSVNGASVAIRFVLGSARFSLTKEITTLDRGAGVSYQLIEEFFLYVGSEDTRTNPVTLEVLCSEDATVNNAGMAIEIARRAVQ